MTRAAPARRRMTALATVLAAALALGALGGGATTALFREVEQVQAGSFTSGRLNLNAAPAHTTFQVRDMAPGDTGASPVELTNTGTVALNWTPSVRVTDPGQLASALRTRTFLVTSRDACTPLATPEATLLDTPGWSDAATTFTGQAAPAALGPDQVIAVCLQVTLDRTASSELAGHGAALEWVFDAVQATPAPPVPGVMSMTYDLAAPGCTTSTVTLPTNGVREGSVDWGDGVTADLTDAARHTYGQVGRYAVTIEGTFDGYGSTTPASNACLISVDRWDDETGTTNLYQAFRQATNLTQVIEIPDGVTNLGQVLNGAKSFNGDLSTWDTSQVTNLAGTFNGATAFNGDLSTWDTSQVTNLAGTFNGATAFNGDISTWDTSKVTTLESTFAGASTFNGDLSAWDTSSVTTLATTFYNATSFNGDISTWDTSQVTSLSYTFYNATSFDRDISTWDTSQVTTLSSTFYGARSFNQDLSEWDTAKVSTLLNTFYNATAFNGDISAWDTGSVTTMRSTFYGASTFNRDLSGWNTSQVTNLEATFYGASTFNGDVSTWDTSKVTTLRLTFANAPAFDRPVGAWNTSAVTTMFQTFANTSAFNQNLAGWDTSRVTSMSGTFYGATRFNGDVTTWRTGNVTDMSNIFNRAAAFNQDLSRWDVSRVTNRTGYNSGASSWVLPKPMFT